MKPSSTPLRRTALVAMLVGAAPLLVAQSGGPHASDSSRHGRDSSMSQDQGIADQNASTRDQRMRIRPAADDPRGRKASDLLGSDVYGSGGEQLGELKDLVVDARTGKILYAVVSSGGIVGIGADLRAVPIENCTAGSDRITIDVNQTRWKQAPVFTKAQLLSLDREDRGAEIHQFFGSAQSTDSSTHHSKQQAAGDTRHGPLQIALVSDIRGKEIKSNAAGDDLREIGEVDDVIVHLKNRTVAALVDAEDDFVGGDRNYLVPLSKLNGFNTDTLTANLTREDFAGARQSNDDSWSAPIGYLSTLYVWPVYGTDTFSRDNEPRVGGTASLGTRDRSGSMASQDDQGAPPVDAVRQAIRDAAPDVQNKVRVVAEKDKVVLRGTVPNEDVKERIEDRAEKAALDWDVESQIRVANNER